MTTKRKGNQIPEAFWDESSDQFRLLTDKAVFYCVMVLAVLSMVFA